MAVDRPGPPGTAAGPGFARTGPTVPLVLHASQVQFAPSGRLGFARVESRMVLLCRAGGGEVRVNGRTHRLRAGATLVLPWGHAISYHADDVDPFLVGGAHLVPAHDVEAPIHASIPHDPRHALAGCAWRRDDPGLATSDVVVSSAVRHPALTGLTHYAISLFERGRPADDELQALGTLMCHELRTLDRPADTTTDLPADLRRVISYVEDHLEHSVTVGSLAAVAGCSEATLTRHFRQHLGAAPMAWVIRRRMTHATQLLRTTELPVAQVARRCGVPDPYYFSRLFREHHGTAPSTWRAEQQVL